MGMQIKPGDIIHPRPEIWDDIRPFIYSTRDVYTVREQKESRVGRIEEATVCFVLAVVQSRSGLPTDVSWDMLLITACKPIGWVLNVRMAEHWHPATAKFNRFTREWINPPDED